MIGVDPRFRWELPIGPEDGVEAGGGEAGIGTGPDAVRSSDECSAQCFRIESQASWTDPPTDSVDLLKIESPDVCTKTATLSLWVNSPLPPS
jgi:hypothetical protein